MTHATIWRRGLCVRASRPDVVVVGGGPAGLLLSTLLGAFDVSVLLLEKRSTLPTHPQAHFINHRTMEIFRPLDGLAAEVARETPPLQEWRRFVYSQTLVGGEFGGVDHFVGKRTAYSAFSPEPVAHYSQNRLLPRLLQRAERQASVQIRFGADVQACCATSDGVTFMYTSSDGSYREAAAKFGVFANGANSQLVHDLGIKFHGTGAIQSLLSVHFHSKQLSKALLRNPAMLYFVFNADAVMVVVAHCLSRGEFVAQIPFFPPLQHPADFSATHIHHLIQAAAGIPLHDLQVHSVRPWIMKAETAEAFQRGNLFLAGDAAHVFPPAGGFGMNTGIQDAHNLAWKLAAVVQGLSPTALLSTYTAERRPVVKRNSELSLENWKEAIAVPAALGLDPVHAHFLSDLATGATAVVPQIAAKAALELGLKMGRQLSGFKGPLKLWRRQRMQEVFQSGRSLKLQFLQEDLGFIYSLPGAPVSSPITPFVPDIVPGGRLPHALLQLASGKRISSLDVVSWCGMGCTVVVLGMERAQLRALFESEPLRNASTILAVRIRPPIRSESVEAAPVPYIAHSAADVTDLSPSIRLIEAIDVERRLVGHSAAPAVIVVRPDGHIGAVRKDVRAEGVAVAVRSVFEPMCRTTSF